MAQPAPKMDFKMLIVPAILLGARKLDLTDPTLVQYLQTGLISIAVVVLSIHFLVYSKINSSSNGSKKIWVPPKPKAALPFGLGPAEEPVKVEDFEATTYKDYEIKLLKESVQSVAMSIGIALVTSFKFNIHMSLMVQGVMLPMNVIDNPVLKKYLLSLFSTPDPNEKIYKELFAPPTAAQVQALYPAAATSEIDLTAATSTTTAPSSSSSNSSSSSSSSGSGSRVEELPDEDEDSTNKTKAKKSTAAAAVKVGSKATTATTSAASDLD